MFWLRPILLLAGALFIAALFWWDRRRTRQAASAPPSRATRAEPSFDSMPLASQPATPGHEREPRRALPVIDWSAEAVAGKADVAWDVPVTPTSPREAASAVPVSSPTLMPPTVPASAPASAPALVPAPASMPMPETPPPMIVDWPAESARRIVTLRIVPAGTDRLPGRALRQALTGCGFRHGEFGIFHLPDDEGRVFLSAASLVLPGTLDPAAMDFQRFPGLNVFAVLPGPVSAGRALERLSLLALELAGRVLGRVHDEQSATLTASSAPAWRKRMLASLGEVDAGAAANPSSSVSAGADTSDRIAGPAAAGPAD